MTATGADSEPLTADFFKNLIGENTRMITGRIDTLSEDLIGLARRVEDQSGAISQNKAELGRQADIIKQQKGVIEELETRVGRLETGGVRPGRTDVDSSHARSKEFLKARRSIRIWPIVNHSEESLWKGTGDFIHSALGIPDEDISPEDIESVTPVRNGRAGMGHVRDEAIVTFYCPRKRDLLLASAPNLASFVDAQRKPTAGIRLEIPPELDGTFRLLSRFGARLRAKHGEGTKRHIKFEDIDGTLCLIFKLPGDESWSTVTPSMAKADHDAHTGEEARRIMKRITGTKSLSGPSQRLASPAGPSAPRTTMAPGATALAARALTTLDQLERTAAGQQGVGVPTARREPRKNWAPRPDASRL